MVKVIKDPRVPDFEHHTPYSAGYDLYACVDKSIEINPDETVLISTGIKLDMMDDINSICALVLPRSGISLKTHLRICNSPGLIDKDYRGEIKVIMQNTGKHIASISPLSRIAQLVFINTNMCNIEFVEEFKDNTERGDGGFGSTGK